uniref:SET domain-containing protein n=1 Tax=Steinernema glaseri TaxID=37863 RepID=A0A1I7ZQQ2_9BILA
MEQVNTLLSHRNHRITLSRKAACMVSAVCGVGVLFKMNEELEEQVRTIRIQELSEDSETCEKVAESHAFHIGSGDNGYTYEEFLEIHRPQLESSGVPEHFWRQIHLKLQLKAYDAGQYFEMLCEDGAPAFKCHVRAIKDIDPMDQSGIFIVDHALTFNPKTLRYALHQLPAELKRFKDMFGIDDEQEEEKTHCEPIGVEEVAVDDSEESHGNVEEPSSTEENCVVKDAGNVEAGSFTSPGSVPHLSQSASESSCIYETLCKEDDIVITKLLSKIWKKAMTYTVRTRSEVHGEEDTPIWYLMDEFGMSIGHSKNPNVRIVPFFFARDHCAYNLLFPIEEIKKGDMIQRNYLDTKVYLSHTNWESALLHPWYPVDLSEATLPRYQHPPAYFTLGRQVDSLPENDVERHSFKPSDTLKIYADDTQLIEKMIRVKYELVEHMEQADVIWMLKHFYDFKHLSKINPHALINQFPFENLLTVKDLFAACVLASAEGGKMDDATLEYKPDWLQTTFNLEYELPQFISHFQKREKKGLDNSWIIKPWNLARGLDINVSNNLDFIIRSVETGPKIVCKYIERPLLITRPDNGNNVKFDLRYIVFLKSIQPLDLCIYKNFWIRFGIKEFSLMHLDCHDTHFTVHNYGEAGKVYQMNCHTFMTLVENRYPQLKWAEVQKKINKVIKNAFELLANGSRPTNVVHSNQSRAMYGLDIMLKWNDTVQSDLGVSFIEANFMPDCTRACEYYRDFADTVFETLFTDAPLSDAVEQL